MKNFRISALIILFSLALFSLSCGSAFYEGAIVSDEDARNSGFKYKISYNMYEVMSYNVDQYNPELQDVRDGKKMRRMYKFIFYTNDYSVVLPYPSISSWEIAEGELTISGKHARVSADSYIVFQTGDYTERWQIGRWKTTTSKSWIGDGAVTEKKTRKFFGMYSFEKL